MVGRRIRVVLVLIAAAVGLVVLMRARSEGPAPEAGPAAEDAFVITSPAFEHGQMIPADYTADGKDASPPLAWDNVPEGTVSFALIMDDPDAPLRTFKHWLICEMPGGTRALAEGVARQDRVYTPASAVQGINGFREVGYGGPAPPKGKTHRYYFRLYALDERLDMPGSFSRGQLEAAMKGHVLAKAELMGRYGR